MKINTLLSLLFILLSFFSSVSANAQEHPEYVLVWEDHFNTKLINSQNWDKLYRAGHWGMYMSKSPSVYQFKRKILRLWGKPNNGLEPNDTARFLTGGITTYNKRSIKYGKIEIRCRIKGATGTWPAIWLMPTDRKNWNYPQRAEIDILEYLHREKYVYQTVHTYYTDELGNKNSPKHQVKSKIKRNRFNIYTLEILPNVLIFSINGSETMRYPKISFAPKGQFPFGVESYLMIDMQIGGDWVKHVDPSTFPAYMDIDYVKMYDLKQ